MATVNAPPDFGRIKAEDVIKDLKKSIAQYRWKHYMLRRLPIMGAILFLSTGMMLLFSYLMIPKNGSFELANLNLSRALVHASHDNIRMGVGLAMVIILAFIFGKWEAKEDDINKTTRVFLNGLVLGIAVLPLFFSIDDIGQKIIFTFIWSVAQCVISWQINRTFGYTRIWARGVYYKRSLELLEIQIKECALDDATAGKKRFEIIERWNNEIYLDSVGDTFYFLDLLAKKPK